MVNIYLPFIYWNKRFIILINLFLLILKIFYCIKTIVFLNQNKKQDFIKSLIIFITLYVII